MPSVEDVEKMRAELHYRTAIWERIFHFLDETFIAKDGRDVAVLKAPMVPSHAERVPQEIFEEIMQEIYEDRIKPLQFRLDRLGQAQVKEDVL